MFAPAGNTWAAALHELHPQLPTQRQGPAGRRDRDGAGAGRHVPAVAPRDRARRVAVAGAVKRTRTSRSARPRPAARPPTRSTAKNDLGIYALWQSSGAWPANGKLQGVNSGPVQARDEGQPADGFDPDGVRHADQQLDADHRDAGADGRVHVDGRRLPGRGAGRVADRGRVAGDHGRGGHTESHRLHVARDLGRAQDDAARRGHDRDEGRAHARSSQHRHRRK